MMRDDDDARLTRLLGAVRAEADPALWTRVRARARARPHVPGMLSWAMRPAALAASLALFVASAALALMLASGSSATGGEEYATLDEALMAERDTDVGTPAVTAPAADAAAQDSGSSR